VDVLAGDANTPAPRVRFPELDSAAARRLIDRGPGGRFELVRAIDENRRALYRDRLLDLTPAVLWGPEGCEVLEPRLLGGYLELMLLNAALERAPGTVAAHAAVIARGERAALICGEGGAGKTTLTLALLRCGSAYLSDEVALVDPSRGRVRAYPRSLGIREGTLRLLGEATLGRGSFQATSLTGDRKWYVDPGAVAVAGTCREARLEHLWFLRGLASEPRVSEADPWQAAQQLARLLRHLRATPLERLWTAVDLVSRCRVFDVFAGPPEATASALTRLLDEEGGCPIA
jgi:hypothetical protein